MRKLKHQWIQILIDFTSIIISTFNIVNHAKGLFGLELKRIMRSFWSIVFYSILLFIFLFSAWLCLMIIFYLKMLEYHFSQEASLLFILLLQLFAIVIVALLISQAKRNFYLFYIARYLRK